MADKLTVKSLAHIFSDLREQTVEAELQLPDYYPEVGQIIRCSSIPMVETVAASGDRISVSGDLCVRIVFIGNDKTLNVYEMHQKYTKVIQADSLLATDSVFVRQYVSNVNYRATSPRRIEVRTQVSVKADIYRVDINELMSADNGNEIETHSGSMNCFDVSTVQKVTLDTTDIIPLPGVKGAVSVADTKATVSIIEKKVISNKVMLRGNCEICYTLLVAETQRFECGSVSLPFTGITEVFGIEENDECMVNLLCVCPSVIINSSESDCTATVSAVIEAEIAAGKYKQIDYIDDAYSLTGEAEAECSELNLVNTMVNINEAFSVSTQAECFDEKITEVCSVFCDSLRYCCNIEKGCCKIDGSIICNAVVKTQSGDIKLVTKSIVIEKDIEANNISDCFIDVGVLSCKCSIIDSCKLKIVAELCVNGFLVCKRKCCAAVNIAQNSDKASYCAKNIVLYYANKGESVWSIAKKNHGKSETIRTLNNISEDVLAEDKVLVFPTANI